MHRHVAQRTSTCTLSATLTRRSRPKSLLYGPPIPLELLAITTTSYTFSTSIPTARRTSGKLQSITAATIAGSDAAPTSQIDEPFRRLEKYLQAPYPRQLLPINSELLRKEVFRATRPNSQPVCKELPQAYYHTALEKKGDDLTRFIADEVAIYWCLQFSQDYTQAAKFLNRHSYHPVSALIRNTHWTVLSRQFAVHAAKFDASDSCSAASRLADNFEAYIYALYLDQGLETVYEFLCPIFLKKLYSQAKQLDIPIPKERRVIDLNEDGTLAKPGAWTRLKAKLSQILLRARSPGAIRRIEYKGLTLPDWEVPCSNGRECRRDDCYFDHTGEKLDRAPIHTMWEESPPAIDPTLQSGSGSSTSSATEVITQIEQPSVFTAVQEGSSSTSEGSSISSVPADQSRLEKGIFKRIETLMNSKIEREGREVQNTLEGLIRRKLNEMQSERREDRKAALTEISRMLNTGSEGLPPKIQKMVNAKVEAIAEKTADTIRKTHVSKGKAVEDRLSQLESRHSMLEDEIRMPTDKTSTIKELEDRIARLENLLRYGVNVGSSDPFMSKDPTRLSQANGPKSEHTAS